MPGPGVLRGAHGGLLARGAFEGGGTRHTHPDLGASACGMGLRPLGGPTGVRALVPAWRVEMLLAEPQASDGLSSVPPAQRPRFLGQGSETPKKDRPSHRGVAPVHNYVLGAGEGRETLLGPSRGLQDIPLSWGHAETSWGISSGPWTSGPSHRCRPVSASQGSQDRQRGRPGPRPRPPRSAVAGTRGPGAACQTPVAPPASRLASLSPDLPPCPLPCPRASLCPGPNVPSTCLCSLPRPGQMAEGPPSTHGSPQHPLRGG